MTSFQFIFEKFELYNLKGDSEQRENIVDKEPRVFEQMVDKMRQLWKEIQAEGPYWESWKAK